MKNANFNLQQHVTDLIIQQLEQGVRPWSKPWQHGGSLIPMNLVSGKAYNGINVLLLWMEAEKRGFSSPYWLTYMQCKERGGNVRKGETSTMVVYFIKFNPCKTHKAVEKTCDACKEVPCWRYYNVFNVEQCEGLVLPGVSEETVFVFNANAQAESLLEQSGAKIKHSPEGRAYYQSAFDYIHLPDKSLFSSESGYYTTALHELVHWTGHHTRLNRDFGKRFGDDAYSFEELVAELGSAFLNAQCGIAGEIENHASYIDHWLKVLKQDKTAIFTACSKASQAFEYILQLQQVNLSDQAA